MRKLILTAALLMGTTASANVLDTYISDLQETTCENIAQSSVPFAEDALEGRDPSAWQGDYYVAKMAGKLPQARFWWTASKRQSVIEAFQADVYSACSYKLRFE